MKVSIILIAVICLFLSACEKKPHADFTMDKDLYQGGDVVTLTNTSSTGSEFEWVLPGGQNETTNDAKYTIDNNTGFDELSFSLSVKSKGHCKHNTITKTVKVLPQTWWQTDVYDNKNYLYKRVSENTSSKVTSDYDLHCEDTNGTGTLTTTYQLHIHFFGSSYPQPGVYSLTPGVVSPGTAQIVTGSNGFNIPSTSKTYSFGKVNVSIINNTLRVFFDSVSVNPVPTIPGDILSGNIYLPL